MHSQAMEANKTFVDMIFRIHNIAFFPFNKKTTDINSLKARKLSTKLLIRNEEKKFHTHNKINKNKIQN